MKKLLVVGITLIFISIAFAPCINANITKNTNNELVEFTTEICGVNGIKSQTVQLTKEDAKDLDILFDHIENQLDKVETREGAEEIFKEAVVELDMYGLLGGLSVKQAQKLVTGSYLNRRIIPSKNLTSSKDRINVDFNSMMCLIAGRTRNNSGTSDYVWFNVLAYLLLNRLIPDTFVYNLVALIGLVFMFPAYFCTMLRNIFLPFGFLSDFFLGKKIIHQAGNQEPKTSYHPCNGWLWTFGFDGVKKFKGDFFGSSFQRYKYDSGIAHFTEYFYCYGIEGFTGLRLKPLSINNPNRYSFLGFAVKVSLSKEYPFN